jgi:cell division protein FtsI/penicillin-binding protein 2
VIVEMPPARGKIFDSNQHELALDVRLDSLYAVSREIKNKSEVALQLSLILGMDKQLIFERLNRDKMFVWIARKISPAKSAAVRKLKVPGLEFVKESQRVYPKGDLA